MKDIPTRDVSAFAMVRVLSLVQVHGMRWNMKYSKKSYRKEEANPKNKKIYTKKARATHPGKRSLSRYYSRILFQKF